LLPPFALRVSQQPVTNVPTTVDGSLIAAVVAVVEVMVFIRVGLVVAVIEVAVVA
jgi:hypothetical protein